LNFRNWHGKNRHGKRKLVNSATTNPHLYKNTTGMMNLKIIKGNFDYLFPTTVSRNYLSLCDVGTGKSLRNFIFWYVMLHHWISCC